MSWRGATANLDHTRMNKFFSYLNLFPMPLWIGMMFAPDHPWTERASRSSTVFGLAAFHYVVALLAAVAAGRKQTRGEPQPGMDFSSLEGVRAGLGTRPGALAAWAHMLALDLFAGAWIYRESRRLSAPAWVRVPSLFFTLMTGPFGLLLFLIWRITGPGEDESL